MVMTCNLGLAYSRRILIPRGEVLLRNSVPSRDDLSVVKHRASDQPSFFLDVELQVGLTRSNS